VSQLTDGALDAGEPADSTALDVHATETDAAAPDGGASDIASLQDPDALADGTPDSSGPAADADVDSGPDTAPEDEADADAMPETADALPDESDAKPVACEDLPALCGVSACGLKNTVGAVPYDHYWKTMVATRASRAFYAHLSNDAVSYWLPVTLEQKPGGVVRLYASWFNHVRSSVQPQYASVYGGCDTCQLLKTSLLPSGCVMVDVDLDSGKVVGRDYVPTTPAQFDYAASNWFQDVACAKLIGKAPSGQPVVLALNDGRKVTAHPGRASVHAMLVDPEADISPLVRDVGAPDEVTPTVAPVLAVQMPGNATPQGIELDVSVCHASPSQLTASGCTCPTTPAPTGPPTSQGETWLEIVAGPFEITITQSYLDALEPAAWTGVGVAKPAYPDFPPDSPCCWKCAQSDPDWACAGWLDTANAVSTLVYLHHLRYRWQPLFMQMGAISPPPKDGSVVSLSVNPQAQSQLLLPDHGLAPRALPPKLRDSAWTYLQQFGKPKSVSIAEWGPLHTQFVVGALPVRICRRLAPHTGPAVFKDSSALCKVVMANVRGRVVVAKKPGAPAK